MKITSLTVRTEDDQDVMEVLTGAINAAVADLRQHVSTEMETLRVSQAELGKELREHIDSHLPRRPRQRVAQ